MAYANFTIADQVEAAIAVGSADRCCEMAERVTALFVTSAANFDIEQHALFADIFERLVNTIELRALADVSARIALAEISAQLAQQLSRVLGGELPVEEQLPVVHRHHFDPVHAPPISHEHRLTA